MRALLLALSIPFILLAGAALWSAVGVVAAIRWIFGSKNSEDNDYWPQGF